MKTSRALIIVSLLLNVSLLGVAGWLQTRPVAGPVSRTIVITEFAEAPVVAPPPPPAATNAEIATGEGLRWGDVASTNLESYVANLRAIRCPEPIIRRIIEGELDALFTPRLEARLDPLRHQFWQILANWKQEHERVEKELESVETLDTERGELLNKLVGPEPTMPEDEVAARGRLDERTDFLPVEKRDQLAALQRKFREDRWKLQDAARTNETSVPPEKLQALNRELERAQKELLTAEELEEFRLRSRGGPDLRSLEYLEGFNPEQVRALAKLERDFRDANPRPRDDDPEIRNRITAEFETRLQDQIKGQLSADQYAELQRAKDPHFQQAYQLTERYGLPREAAIRVYDLQRAAGETIGQLWRSKQLSADERDAAMDALSAEMQRSITLTLGDRAARTYINQSGGLIEEPPD